MLFFKFNITFCLVVAAYKEPIPGWQDSLNGPLGLYLIIAKGIIKTMLIDVKKSGNFVAVDAAINLILVATWKRGITK